MKSQKKLGKGLRDISSYFIAPAVQEAAPEPAVSPGHTGCRILFIVDDLYPRYSSVLTLTVGRQLAGRGYPTLLLDGLRKFPRLSFGLGKSVPGISVFHFLNPMRLIDTCLISAAPRLSLFLPLFNPQDFLRMDPLQRYGLLKVLQKAGENLSFILARVPVETDYRCLYPLTRELIFLVSSEMGEMGQGYRQVKEVISTLRPESIGVVIVGADDESLARRVYERFQEGVDRFWKIPVAFSGLLPPIADSGDLLAERAIAPSQITAITDRILQNDGRERSYPKGDLFFKRVENVMIGAEMTPEETSFFRMNTPGEIQDHAPDTAAGLQKLRSPHRMRVNAQGF
jgi:hypothetical protein